VVYVQNNIVQRSGNGMAVASLVLGILGVVFGLIPLFFFFAFIFGTLALIFGLVGRAKKYQGFRKGFATAGSILAVVSLGLGVFGVIVVNEVVDDIDKCFTAIGNDFQNDTDTSDAACD
jgi:hypothetical protein